MPVRRLVLYPVGIDPPLIKEKPWRYAVSTTVHQPYDTVVDQVRVALDAQGFGILTEIDIQATMKAKLDADVPAQVILGACRPPLALAALQAEPSIGLLLPCNVVVRALDASTTSGRRRRPSDHGVHDRQPRPARRGRRRHPAAHRRPERSGHPTHRGDVMVQLDPTTVRPVSNRLKRAQGQLNAVIRMLDEGEDCEAVVTQLAAVSRALDRAGFAIIATGLKQCLAEEGGAESLDTQKMEKLFLSLA